MCEREKGCVFDVVREETAGKKDKGDEKIKYCRPTIENVIFSCNTFCSCVRGTVWLVIFFLCFFSLLLV